MTDAEKREKVIRGLESIWRCVSPVSHTCGDCPYQGNRVECKRRVVTDALALLREQEPRVMTLEELHSDLWIWMEYPGEEEGYDNYIGYAYLEGRMFEDWWFLTAGAEERLVCPLKSYGQVWRVWTSCPSPEQMRNTPWEAIDNG